MAICRFPAWLVALGGGGCLIAAFVGCSGQADAAVAVYLTAAVGAAGMLATTALRHRQSRGRGWQLLALGFAAFAAGDTVWGLHSLLGIRHAPVSLADAFYLASYPLLAGAMFAVPLARSELIETIARQLVDAGVLFVAAFSAVWFISGDEVLRAGSSDAALSVTFVTLDLVMLALVVRFVFGAGRWPPSYRLLACAMALLFGGDLAWRLMLAVGTFGLGSWVNPLFIAGYAFAAAATLHPSADEVAGFAAGGWYEPAGTIGRRLGLLAIAALVPGVVVSLVGRPFDSTADRTILVAAIVVLPLLILTRGALLVRATRQMAAATDAARRRADAVVAASPLPICVVDRSGVVRIWNQAAEEASGYRAADVVGGAPPVDPARDPARVADLLERALAGERLSGVDVTLCKPDGTAVDVRVSTAPIEADGDEIIALFEDVTLELRQQTALDQLAHYDSLTGLPNRSSFEERLVAAEKRKRRVWVALLDVDNFKSINDSVGHAGGDDVLRELAALLRRELRHGDFLARLSGDEFALLLYDIPEPVAAEIVERLLSCARDFRLRTGKRTIDLTVSAGLASIDPTLGGESALKRSDAALLEAKRLGKNRFELWADGFGSETQKSRAWSPIIKDALRDDRLELFLQPIVPLRGDGPPTFEALARLRLPTEKVVEAQYFVCAAEELGLMDAIDHRMLEHAEALIRSADDDLRVFVNVSPGSFHSGRFLRRLERALAELPPHSLGIEITEHTAFLQPHRAGALLTRLIDAGALVAIDDFGLGFTSFAELATLPCHLVKIPVDLTRHSEDPTVADAITRAVTNVAHAYGKEVVIEGIETPEAHERARRLGIEYGQGWHYGWPEPAASRLVAAAAS